MARRICLFSDLDRTILPNGHAPESPRARPLLRAFAARPETLLVYVSGRDRRLLQEAIEAYDIPVPDFAIGDVGTSIFETGGGDWRTWREWDEEIGRDWHGLEHDDLAGLFADLAGLTLQEPEKQKEHKLSYYVDLAVDHRRLLAGFRQRLDANGVRANLIWSIDDLEGVGLLDVLPAGANKVHAIRFLMARQGLAEEDAVYAGDSGNDLPALTSGLKAVLVKNARSEVREEAVREVSRRQLRERLYLARGDFLGMNGNYAAGVLEGVAHFFPEALGWLQGALPADSAVQGG